ncbi:MAG: hypothetical protein KG003_14050 [Bacteroidetes bacterium]|nr:hypothetical protein [Bacteroidota bacterium]
MKWNLFILLLFMASFSHAETTPAFRGYKLSVSTDLQMNPFFMLGVAKYKNTLIQGMRPGIGIEAQATGGFSVFLLHSRFKHSFSIEKELPRPDYMGNDYYRSDGTANYVYTEFQIRKYSTSFGYLAPWGRFISYGLFQVNFSTDLKNNQYNTYDEFGNPIVVTLRNTRSGNNVYRGLAMQYGKKYYLGKTKRVFFESRFGYKFIFASLDAYYMRDATIPALARFNAVRKFNNSSVFSLNLSLGVSL